MKNYYLPFLTLLAVCSTAIAQTDSKSRKEKQGDKYAFVYSFDKAINSYSKSNKLTVEGQRQLAKSYYNMNRFTEAETAYSKLLSDTAGILPDDHFNYAMSLKANGKYEEANTHLETYKTLKPYACTSKSYDLNKNSWANLLRDQYKYKIEHLNLNTDAEDFGTCFYKDKIVFASSRVVKSTNDDKFNWNNKPFLDMYVCSMNGIQLENPKIFSQEMNTVRHDGSASFNKAGTFMAFTTNGKTDSKKENVIGLQIWFSEFKDSVWTCQVPFDYNSENYSVGQPCLLADGKTLYFTSDMPGGYGGADIYRSSIDTGGRWTKPVNMGDLINTEKDEMFPFFTEKNNILLFTSNGHYGLGGLDIFMCAISGTVLGKVYNAGAPLNSSSDDFAAIVDDNTNKGYFSSDRIGGSGDDDIYSVEFLKGLKAGNKIILLAKDTENQILPGTYLSLFNNKGQILDTMTTVAEIPYFAFVDSDNNFKVTGTKLNYTKGSKEFDTYGKEFEVKVDVILVLPPKKEEIIAKMIVVGADLGKILELKPIYFDVNKYNIRPDAEIELDKIVKIMSEYPNMIIELGSYTDCRNSKAFNLKLSNKRAKASAAYVQRGITSEGRVFGKGYGETKLVNNCACEKKVVSNCSEEEHQLNRRTEFIILKK